MKMKDKCNLWIDAANREHILDRMLEIAHSHLDEEPLPPNSHWNDPNGKHGFSEYFWKYKYPQICEATGVDPSTGMPLEAH